eukprot:3179569-Pyramimonas_sp.AAC.1
MTTLGRSCPTRMRRASVSKPRGSRVSDVSTQAAACQWPASRPPSFTKASRYLWSSPPSSMP